MGSMNTGNRDDNEAGSGGGEESSSGGEAPAKNGDAPAGEAANNGG